MRSLTKKLGISFENLENSNLFTSPCSILRIYSILQYNYLNKLISFGFQEGSFSGGGPGGTALAEARVSQRWVSAATSQAASQDQQLLKLLLFLVYQVKINNS